MQMAVGEAESVDSPLRDIGDDVELKLDGKRHEARRRWW